MNEEHIDRQAFYLQSMGIERWERRQPKTLQPAFKIIFLIPEGQPFPLPLPEQRLLEAILRSVGLTFSQVKLTQQKHEVGQAEFVWVLGEGVTDEDGWFVSPSLSELLADPRQKKQLSFSMAGQQHLKFIHL
jgi:DNA polymerase III psi subunit